MKHELRRQLNRPFAPKFITWKPGSTSGNGKALAMGYADTRAYQERLDELFGFDWSVRYSQAAPKTVVCELTLTIVVPPSDGGREERTSITRSATGEDDDLMSAEARAFKRACSAFGLGRYLYDLPSVWVDFDARSKRLTDAAIANLDQRYKVFYDKAMATHFAEPEITMVEPAQIEDASRLHLSQDEAEYERTRRRFHALGTELYKKRWDDVRAHNIERLTSGRTNSAKDLTLDELRTLVAGMQSLKDSNTQALSAMARAQGAPAVAEPA